MTCTLRKDLSTFFTISRLILLRMRNVSDKVCRENQNTFHIQHFFFFENCTINETMSKNMVEPEEPQMTSQYGAYALRARLARLHERIRMHTPTRPGTHARTHTQTNKKCFFFLQQQWFAKAPQCYVIRALPVLFNLMAIFLILKLSPCLSRKSNFCVVMVPDYE